MTFLLANWKLCIIGALVALCAIFFALWQSAKADLAEVKAAGEYAQQEKERIEALYNTTLKETTDAWSKAVPAVRANAVAEYIKRFGRVCDSGKVPVPGTTESPQVLHGTEQERIPSGPDAFIANCAEDALFRVQVRTWVTKNQLEVE
jgi:type II secretory pathway pseudopilin PulG